jgi:hypothetical protein
VKSVEGGEQLVIFLFGHTPARGLKANGVILSGVGVVEIYPIVYDAAITKDMGDD